MALTECLDRVDLTAGDVAMLNDMVARYNADGKTPKQAEVSAARAALSGMLQERNNVSAQVAAKGGFIPRRGAIEKMGGLRKGGLTRGQVQQAISGRTAGFADAGLKLKVVGSNELAGLGVNQTSKVKGFYRDGTAYLVHDNLDTPEDARVAIAHEAVAHFFAMKAMQDPSIMASLVPDAEWNGWLKSYRNLKKAGGKRFDSIMKEVNLRYPNANEIVQSREFLAITEERRIKDGAIGNLYRRAVSMFVNALRKAKIITGAFELDRFRMSDVDEILRYSEQASMGQAPTPAQATAPALSGAQFSMAEAKNSGYEGEDRGEAKEWLAAVAKGLPMDKASRMKRAKEMGMEVAPSKVKYHGTNAAEDFSAFNPDLGLGGGAIGVWLDSSPVGYDMFMNMGPFGDTPGGRIIPVYVKGSTAEKTWRIELTQGESNTIENGIKEVAEIRSTVQTVESSLQELEEWWQTSIKNLDSREERTAFMDENAGLIKAERKFAKEQNDYMNDAMDRLKEAKAKDPWTVMMSRIRSDMGVEEGEYFEPELAKKWRENSPYERIELVNTFADTKMPRNWTIVMNPADIRSVNAAFDPDNADSSDLLASQFDVARDSNSTYSMVERRLIEMSLPEWKAGKAAKIESIMGKLQKMSGVQKAEMELYELYDIEPDTRFTQEEIVQHVRDRLPNVDKVVAETDVDDAGTDFGWFESVITDRTELEGLRRFFAIAHHKVFFPDTKLTDDEIAKKHAEEEPSWSLASFESHEARGLEDTFMRTLTIVGNAAAGYQARWDGQEINEIGDNPDENMGYFRAFNEAKLQAEGWAYETGNAVGGSSVGSDELYQYREYIHDGHEAENYREIKFRLPDYGYYENVHFPDENMLGFIRATNRSTGTNEGNQTKASFHVDELQSDWDNDARKAGGYANLGELEAASDKVASLEAGALKAFYDTVDLLDRGGKSKVLNPGVADTLRSIEDPNFVLTALKSGMLASLPVRRGLQIAASPTNSSAATDRIDFVLDKGSLSFIDGALDVQPDIMDYRKAVNKAKAHLRRPEFQPFQGAKWLRLATSQALMAAVDEGSPVFSWNDSTTVGNVWGEPASYASQYDNKMVSLVKKMTGKLPQWSGWGGESTRRPYDVELLQEAGEKGGERWGLVDVNGEWDRARSGEIEWYRDKETAEKVASSLSPSGYWYVDLDDAAMERIYDTATFFSIEAGDPDLAPTPMPTLGEVQAIETTIRGRLNEFRYNFQDKMIDAKEVQKGRVSNEDADFYMAESIWQGLAGEKLANFERDYLTPLLEAIGNSSLTMGQVGEYLHARHAEEANAYLEEINPNRDNNKALSGMSNEEAREILEHRRANEKLPAVAKLVDKINKARVDLLVDNDLLSPFEANAWMSRYGHYVPLSRADFNNSVANLSSAHGQGFNIKGKESKQRVGSSMDVDHDNLVGNMISQYQVSQVRAEKNRVGKALLNFVYENSDPAWWKVDEPELMSWVKYKKDPENELKMKGEAGYSEVNPANKDNVLSVKVDGEQHFITFNEENPSAMRLVGAMKNLDQTGMNRGLRTLMSLNRFLSAMNTNYNIEFFISNPARDVQTAAYNLTSTELEGMELKIMADFPKAVKGLKKNIRNEMASDANDEWVAWAERFRKAGGKTGWIDVHNDLEKTAADLNKRVERFNKTGRQDHILKPIIKLVDDYNTIVENAIRLSAFKHGVTPVEEGGGGMSERAAASLAKDLTVNFNRKGMYGPAMNAAFLFFNASMQGSVRMLQTLKHSKKGRKLAGATVGFAMIFDILNRILSGDDDDGENRYDALPDHVKNRNLIIMGEDGPIFKWPLPWGYNALHVLGQELGRGFQAATEKDQSYSPLDSAGRFTSSVLDAFNPVGQGTLLQTLAPTVIDPFAQIAENKNWAGIPVMPESFGYGPELPNAERYWSSSRESSKAIAKFLSEGSGGSSRRPGFFDVSPEWLDLLVDFAGGAALRTVTDSLNMGHKLAIGEDIEVDDIIILRKLYGYDDRKSLPSRYYDRAEDISIHGAEIKDARKQKSVELVRELRSDPRSRMIAREKYVRSRLRELRANKRKVISRYGDDDREKMKIRVDSIDERMRSLMAKFSEQYAEAVMPKGWEEDAM